MERKSALIIATAVITGFIVLSGSIIYAARDFAERYAEENRYEFISANDTNIIIFDRKTGRYWRKFIEEGAGPTEWT